jgi:hypothetical protein
LRRYHNLLADRESEATLEVNQYAIIRPPYRCARLQEVFSNWCSVVHSIEGCHLIDSHWRHLQQSRNLIHNAQTRETGLSLSQIQQRHDGSLLVLRRVSLQDLIDELVVLLGELEWDAGVVLGSIAML